jgi:hypothetical protein
LTPTTEDAGRSGDLEWAYKWSNGTIPPTCHQRLRTQALTGLWPTPRANSHTGAGKSGEGGINLQTATKLWPTTRAKDGEHGGPNQRDSRGNYALAGSVHHSEIRSITATGQLNPDWVETLMCVPDGWTDLEQEVELPEAFDHPRIT